jgi:hypothetical protein
MDVRGGANLVAENFMDIRLVRIFLLIVYFIINILVSAALILLVVLAPTRYLFFLHFIAKNKHNFLGLNSEVGKVILKGDLDIA